MDFYLAPYEAVVDPRENEVVFQLAVLGSEPHVDLALARSQAEPGWGFVASPRITPAMLPAGTAVTWLGGSLGARLEPGAQRRVVEALGIRPQTVGDVLYRTLIDPAPAEGGKRKPNRLVRSPSGLYEVHFGDLTVTWSA